MTMYGPANGSGESLFTLLRTWHNEGIPKRIDASLLTPVPKSVRGVMMRTLLALNLVRENGTPSPNLEIVVYGSKREEQLAWRDVLYSAYPFILGPRSHDFDIMSARPDDLKVQFERAGAKGENVTKAENLFLQLAKHASVPLGPNVKAVRAIRKPSNRMRRSTTMNQVVTTPPSMETPTEPTTPVFSVSPPEPATAPGTQEQCETADEATYQLISGLVKKLPKNGRWTKERRDRWLRAVESVLDLDITVEDDTRDRIAS